MKKHTQRYWTEGELQFLKENHHNMTIGQMAQVLGRPYCSVQMKASWVQRGVVRFKPGPVWTAEMLSRLRELYPRMNRYHVAKELGTTPDAIKGAIATYGVRKRHYDLHPERLSEEQKGYIAGVLDADGSVLVTKGHHREYGTYLRPSLCLATMAEHETPETIFQWLTACGFVGSLRLTTRRTANHRDVSDLLLRRQREVIALLEYLIPYIIAKRTKAQLLLQFCQAPTQQEKWNIYRLMQASIPVSAQRRTFSRESAPMAPALEEAPCTASS